MWTTMIPTSHNIKRILNLQSIKKTQPDALAAQANVHGAEILAVLVRLLAPKGPLLPRAATALLAQRPLARRRVASPRAAQPRP